MSAATETEQKPATTDGDEPDSLCHLSCPCSPEIAVCGRDLVDYVYVELLEDEDLMCIVCDNTEICPRCGARSV